MTYPVEIKINVDGAVDDSLTKLAPAWRDAERQDRKIWFAEQRAGVERGELLLFERGLIVRFRSGDKCDDLTAKFRPCDPSRLVDPWTKRIDEGSFEYGIEGDWSGERHVLAASATKTEPPGALLKSVLKADEDAAAALTKKQRRFIDHCVRPDVNVDALVALGPIESTKWSGVRLGDLDVNVERWTVSGAASHAEVIRMTRYFQDHGELPSDCDPDCAPLDFLELSIRVRPQDDETAHQYTKRVTREQQRFADAVSERGIVPSQRRENKTQRVLTTLATRYLHGAVPTPTS